MSGGAEPVRRRVLLGTLGMLLLVFSWWALTAGLGIINPDFLPGPVATWKAMLRLLTTGPVFGQGAGYGGVNLLGHMLASASRVLLGFVLVIFISLPLGLVMAGVPAVGKLLNPLVQLLRPIPPIAWAPLAILWFGTGLSAVLFAITIGVVWPLVISTIAGVSSVPTVLVRAASALGANPVQIYLRVIVPAAMPYLFTGLRLAFGMAWWMIIPAELIAAEKGLGYLIARAQDNNNTADILVGIVAIAVVGFAFDWLFRQLQRWRFFSTPVPA